MRIKKVFYNVWACVIFIGLFSSCSYSNNQSSQKLSKSVVIKGTSAINVKSDTAILELRISKSGKDINNIIMKSNKIIDDILDSLAELGIDNNDIYISRYDIYPITYEGNFINFNNFSDYDMSSYMSIKVRDINKIGEIITKATKAGADTYNEIEFTVNDYDKYYKEALKKAIEDGNNKAKEISKSLGVDLGTVVKIDEDKGYFDYNENNDFTNINYEKKFDSVIGVNKLIRASVNMTFEY